MAAIHVVWIVTVEDGRVKHRAKVAAFHEATLVGTQVELSTVVWISVMAVRMRLTEDIWILTCIKVGIP